MQTTVMGREAIERLKALTEKASERFSDLMSMSIVESDVDLGEHWTGKVVVDGKAVDVADFRAKEGPVEYGPEDVDALLWMGRIKKEFAKTDAIAIGDLGKYWDSGVNPISWDDSAESTNSLRADVKEPLFNMGVKSSPVLGFRPVVGFNF